MSDRLQVPGDQSSPTNNAFTGRPRSGSTRSQRSQQSQRSQRNSVTEASTETDVDFSRRPSIRIRRTPSSSRVQSSAEREGVDGLDLPIPSSSEAQYAGASGSGSGTGGRSRSNSAPAQPGLSVGAGSQRRASYLPDLTEEVMSPSTGSLQHGVPADLPADVDVEAQREPATQSGSRRLRKARTNIARQQEERRRQEANDEYETELVDILDLVDPEISTLQTLTNVQNSLVVPHIPYMGRWIDRRPTYSLSRRPLEKETEKEKEEAAGGEPDVTEGQERPEAQKRRSGLRRTSTANTLNTITSRVNDKYYAVLPHGVTLPGWTEEEKLELNDHVRHMMHSKRSKFKRGMKGFGQYVKRPLGLFVTVYATLITLFGLIWVLFLIGWINVGGRHDYIINVIDNVLVALFAIIGDGLAPFRAVDTYHMCFIAHYHNLTWRLRREKALPKLTDRNDLPAVQPDQVSDVEKQEFSVLTPKQQQRLAHHQKKFARSHSFYKPHETATHHAFPLTLLVVVVVLLDCHSLLQIALGTCTWSISYHVRPFALTTVILCCSITCNITAGIVISIGDHKTRKKDVLERMFRQELTSHAMKKVEKKRVKGLSPSGTETQSSLDGAGADSEDRMWDAVDEQALEIERSRTGGGVLEPIDGDSEYETPPVSPGSERTSYMPIVHAPSVPQIVTTTVSNEAPGGSSTTTTTRIR